MEHVTIALARAPLFAPPNDEEREVPPHHPLSKDLRNVCDFASRLEARQGLIKAELNARGFLVHATADDGFVVSRWGYSRLVPDLRSLAGLLRQIGGKT